MCCALCSFTYFLKRFSFPLCQNGDPLTTNREGDAVALTTVVVLCYKALDACWYEGDEL